MTGDGVLEEVNEVKWGHPGGLMTRCPSKRRRLGYRQAQRGDGFLQAAERDLRGTGASDTLILAFLTQSCEGPPLLSRPVCGTPGAAKQSTLASPRLWAGSPWAPPRFRRLLTRSRRTCLRPPFQLAAPLITTKCVLCLCSPWHWHCCGSRPAQSWALLNSLHAFLFIHRSPPPLSFLTRAQMFPGCISPWMITIRPHFNSHHCLCSGALSPVLWGCSSVAWDV